MKRLVCVIVPALAAAAWAEPAPVKTKEQAKETVSSKALVPFPAPLITEILYAVPTGETGDANKDGTRQVAGDEFVELINPHDKPIDLAGWTLSDKSAGEKTTAGKPKSGGLRFTFPACTLKPGQVVVVFNGFNSTFEGPVGDGAAAPEKPNEKFGGALVFTMRNTGERTSFSNASDWVLLSDADGKPVHLIKWGDVGKAVEAPLVETAPAATKASVQRAGPRGALAPHAMSNGVSFSPGVFAGGIKAKDVPPEKKPEPVKTPPAAPIAPDKNDKKPEETPASPPPKPKW